MGTSQGGTAEWKARGTRGQAEKVHLGQCWLPPSWLPLFIQSSCATHFPVIEGSYLDHCPWLCSWVEQGLRGRSSAIPLRHWGLGHRASSVHIGPSRPGSPESETGFCSPRMLATEEKLVLLPSCSFSLYFSLFQTLLPTTPHWGLDPGTFCMLGKCSYPKPHPRPRRLSSLTFVFSGSVS